MKNDREKEIHRLMNFKSEIIKQEKKALKELRRELERIEASKSIKLTRKRR